jgi:hypothetical protein
VPRLGPSINGPEERRLGAPAPWGDVRKSEHISFKYFLCLLVISNAIGAFSTLIGGLSGRIGRANLMIYGSLGRRRRWGNGGPTVAIIY